MGKFSGESLLILRDDIELVSVPHEWVWRYRKQAAQSGIDVKPRTRARWWRTRGLEAFIGSIGFGHRHARMKAVYVFPEWRGEGIGLTTTRRLFDTLVAEGVEKISIYVLKPEIFEPVGFVVKSKPWKGTSYMEWIK